jgi:hypothetical protein
MATVKKGQLARATEWWRHLRWTKRAFWKRERQAGRRMAERESVEDLSGHRADFKSYLLGGPKIEIAVERDRDIGRPIDL